MTDGRYFHADLSSESIQLQQEEDAVRRMSLYSVQAIRRASAIDRIFVAHPDFVKGLETLDRLFQLAPEFSIAHGAVMVGPPGCGKSSLIRDFRERLPKSSLFERGHAAIAIRAYSAPTAGGLISALLTALEHPFGNVTNRTLSIKRRILFDLFREMGTRMIVVDEADRLLFQIRRHREGQQPEATQFLRDMMDECSVALVLVGSPALDRLDQFDGPLADRLSVRQAFKHFGADKEWLGFLRAFAKQSDPFDFTLLNDQGFAAKLHRASGGNLRRVKRLLTEATLICAHDGKSVLSLDSFVRAFPLVEGQDALRASPFL